MPIGIVKTNAKRIHRKTQLEVAEKASLTANAYARIERGERQPSSDSLRKLVKALGIDPSKVL
jgi:transcriptional regulator with XRE-family HTH domain